MQKNVANQKWVVFAFDRTDSTPKTGDAANITANLRIDGGAADAVDDTNPTELEDGFYVFDITQAESNGNMILISPASTTTDIQVIGVPGVVFTTAPSINTLNIANGAVEGDMTYIHGTALTETAGQLAGAFVKFFDVASPTGTVNSLPDAAPDAAGGLPISDAGSLDMDAMSGITLAGTASAGSATTVTLTGGVAATGYYDGQLVKINAGTGAGQSRTILAYDGGTAVATVTRDWAVAPAADSVFSVYAADVPAILEAGTATAGGNATITLDANASADNNTYKSNFISISAGTGIGQTRLITAYNGTSKIATIVPNWETNPAAGSVYQIAPSGQVNVGEWLGEPVVSPTANGVPVVDLTHIHGTALTETSGQLAGRFVNFFDQASATFSVATALADFKATGFSTHSANDVTGGTTVDAAYTTLSTEHTSIETLVTAEAAELDAANLPSDIDAIKAVTDMLPDSGALTTIAADAARLTAARAAVLTDWIDGGRLDLLLDACSTHDAAAVKTAMEANDSKLDHLWEMTEDDSGVRRLTTNALEQAPGGGGSVAVGSFTQAALAQFCTDDTGETAGVAGSVAKIAQGAAGGNVTVAAFTQAALAQFATDDTGETTPASGSVLQLSGAQAWTEAEGVVVEAGVGEADVHVMDALMIVAAYFGGDVSGYRTSTVTITGAHSTTTRITETVSGNAVERTIVLP